MCAGIRDAFRGELLGRVFYHRATLSLLQNKQALPWFFTALRLPTWTERIPQHHTSEDIKNAVRRGLFLLRWEDVHAASLKAFIRLWKEAGATTDDYRKIDDLSRLLIRTILGQADRRTTMNQVEEQLGSTNREGSESGNCRMSRRFTNMLGVKT